MANYGGDLYAIFQNPLPPTNTAPPCYNEASFSFPNRLQDPTGVISVTNCLYPLLPPPPNTNTIPHSLASFTFNEYNEGFSFPINTNTTPPSLASLNIEEYIAAFYFPSNTNTAPSSLASLNFNEDIDAFYFPNMLEQPLIITDEYADELDQMLAHHCRTTTSTTNTRCNNGFILNPNSPPDLAGQSHHLPPNPVLLAPPSKEPRQHVQKHQKQVYQVQASRALAKERKSEQKKRLFHEDNKLSSDSWACRKYGQKSMKGTPYPRKSQQVKTVFHVTEDKLSSLDSWAWRKYGKKSIKGTPYPRNYFKCTSSKNCPALKRVEQSNIKSHMFIVTYKGEHSHLKPTENAKKPAGIGVAIGRGLGLWGMRVGVAVHVGVGW
ncbi:WRKY transcription factor 23-like [Lotus japonicus]|uniref:WRKY transcription factor 23-like n=1 Tax=Lotus japonicus TaxID=34305 RepID=UPI00258DE16B|nr:WRKY transcription factor 23-like [Lotus japonicus]